MIKKLIKFIIGLVVLVVVVILAVVGITLYMISDKTDEAPIDKYDTTLSTNAVLKQKLSASLDNMGTDYALNLQFDEDSLNQFIYSFIRKSLNSEYDPKNGTTDSQKMVFSAIQVPSELPYVGGKTIGVKSIYGKMNGDFITINATADVAGKIKSRLYFTFKVETKENEYVLNISEIKFGKINLTGNLAMKGLTAANAEKLVNDKFTEMNLPFVFKLEGMTLTASKADISSWIKKVLSVEGEGDMKAEFVDLILAPENDMLKFGMFTKGFGISINLDKLKVPANETNLDEAIKENFDAETYIKSKAQALVYNTIGDPTAPKYLSLHEVEISRLIYTKLEGYKDFKIETQLIEGVNFKFSVDGIVVDVNDTGDKLYISVILNVNGLKTTAKLVGNVSQTSDQEIKVALGDKIILGNGLEIGSKFLTDMLSENFNTSDIMKYDAATNSFIFTAELFDTMLSEMMNASNTPLTVSKIAFVKDQLNIYVDYSDTTFANTLSEATTLLRDALSDGVTLDTTQYSSEDQAAVTELQSELNDISAKLDAGTLTAEDTEALVEAMDGLSTEGKETFLDSMKDKVTDPSKLEELYGQMFKK